MGNLHPALEALNQRKKAGEFASEAEYENARKFILEEIIGIGSNGDAAPAPMLLPVPSQIQGALTAKDLEDEKRQQAIEAFRKNGGRVANLIPTQPKGPIHIPTARWETLPNGEKVKRLLSQAEIDQAKKRAEEANKVPLRMPTQSIIVPPGWEVREGVLRPKEKAQSKPEDSKIAEIRAQIKEGTITLEQGRALVQKIKDEQPLTGGLKTCPICQGNPDKITGKLCACGGKGKIPTFFTEHKALERDYLRDGGDFTYVAYLATGGSTTIHADSGKKMVMSACKNLLDSGTGFNQARIEQGCLLVIPAYYTQCPGCFGKGIQRDTQKVCPSCNGECRTFQTGGIFWFPDPETADQAGLDSLTGYDESRKCGQQKCKGESCYKCRDARMGGYQHPGYLKCPECKGSCVVMGEPCERCRARGYLTTTVFVWAAGPGYALEDTIKRTDLLSWQKIRKPERNLTIKLGNDTVEVGPGKIPSRKSGSVLHKTGTAKKKYDNAKDVYGGKGVLVQGPGKAHETRVEFSKG